jgi:hypothetical protein
MNQLSMTLSRSAKDIGGFSIIFFIVFFAYAQLGYLLFGSQVCPHRRHPSLIQRAHLLQMLEYSTFTKASLKQLRSILGDFDFDGMQQCDRVLGPVFFITYVFFVFFVLIVSGEAVRS